MNNKLYLGGLAALFLGASFINACTTQNKEEEHQGPQLTKIAFGSCGHQNHELPVLNLAADHQPDVFLFLGDNIYGDTKDMQVLRDKYDKLGSKSSFKNLKASTELLAVWDDHDYGWNDAGRHYEYKEESREIFFEFWEVPADSPRRSHDGIYGAEYREYHGKTVQYILLDNRSFRDDVKPYTDEFDTDDRYFYHLDYAPYTSTDSTLLGETQWQWLEKELGKPADLRIIASGSQFGIEYNGYEAWANYPHEQKRFLELIKKTKAEGVVFLTGDVHYAEISKLEHEGLYPIYDVTASGLSSTWHFATPNINRIEGPIMDNHFGMLTIDWAAEPAKVKMEIIDLRDNQRIEYIVSLDELRF